MKNNFAKVVAEAFLHTLFTIIKFVVSTPYKLWAKSAESLVEQKNQNALDLRAITGFWPFITYLKRLIFDFLFDASIFLVYPFGLVAALIETVRSGQFEAFIVIVLVCYVVPVGIAIVRDLCVVALLPIRKLMDWFAKPAQWLEIKKD